MATSRQHENPWVGWSARCGALACALAVGAAWAQEEPQREQAEPPPEQTASAEQAQQPQGSLSGERQAAAQPGESSPSGQSADLQQAAQMIDKKLVDQQGRELGTISKIVRDQQSQELFAVVRSGGFMGMGGSEKVLALSDLQLQGEQVTSTTPLTQQQLDQMASYDEQQYQEVQLQQRAEAGAEASAEEQQAASEPPPEEQAAAEPEEPQQQAAAGEQSASGETGSPRPTY